MPEQGPPESWQRKQAEVRRRFGSLVGLPVDLLPTPALVVDLPTLDKNVERMAAHCRRVGVQLRPHVKVHKSPDLARRQITAGATGVCVATVWEAAVMCEAGITGVLIANQVVGERKVQALAALSTRFEVDVAVDDARNVRALDDAVSAAGGRLGVLLELDVGMRRCGARSADEAARLAEAVSRSRSLVLRGLQAYEGHCMLEPDRRERVRAATEAMELAATVSRTVTDIAPAATTISGGGTGTYDISPSTGVLDELQAGSYVFMDAFHRGLVEGFDFSLSVASTVLSRHARTTVLDAGRKSIGIDFVSPPLVGSSIAATYFAEEHSIFELPDELGLDVGSRVRLLPGYAPTTVNLYDAYFVADEDDVVQDVWPIVPRGPMPL